MSIELPDGAHRERIRAAWRADLMSVPGGLAWLLHVADGYGWNERLLGPDHIGLPKPIALAMAALEAAPASPPE